MLGQSNDVSMEGKRRGWVGMNENDEDEDNVDNVDNVDVMQMTSLGQTLLLHSSYSNHISSALSSSSMNVGGGGGGVGGGGEQ